MYPFSNSKNVILYFLQIEQIERLQQQIIVLEQEKIALQEIISSNKENVIENPVKVSLLNFLSSI